MKFLPVLIVLGTSLVALPAHAQWGRGWEAGIIPPRQLRAINEVWPT